VEISQFLLSLSLSSLGVLADLLTTSVFVKDLRLKFEWNSLVKNVVSRWGYKVWVFCLEIPAIIAIALFDSKFSLGLSWLIGRGFVACINLKTIVEYRIIGIDEFKVQLLSRRQTFRNVSLSNKPKLRLPYLLGLVICFTLYELLFFANFSTVTWLRSLSARARAIITREGIDFVRKRYSCSVALDPREIKSYEFLIRLLSFGGTLSLATIRKWRESEILKKAQKNHYVTITAFRRELPKKEVQEAVKEFWGKIPKSIYV